MSEAEVLARCVTGFETALRQVAIDLARHILASEIDRRRRADSVGARRGRASMRSTAAPSAPPHSTPDGGSSSAGPLAPPPAPGPSRRRWTRDSVIAALCEWLISGIVEPSFLRRHGEPGLVPAATRIFGRFDSALNVANLYLAKQYPNGPPSRRVASGSRPPRAIRLAASPQPL